MEDLYSSLKFVPIVFAALFPVINPVGTSLILSSMTENLSGDGRKRLSLQVSVYSFLLLAFFLAFGTFILKLFGISIPVVEAAGGFVIASMGWKLLNEEKSQSTAATRENAEASWQDVTKSAFYPFTFPITVGPGGISVMLTLSAHANHDSMGIFSPSQLGAVIGILLICLVTYFSLVYLPRVLTRLSESGALALSRMIAFFLVCIGAEIAWHGIQVLFAIKPT